MELIFLSPENVECTQSILKLEIIVSSYYLYVIIIDGISIPYFYSNVYLYASILITHCLYESLQILVDFL